MYAPSSRGFARRIVLALAATAAASAAGLTAACGTAPSTGGDPSVSVSPSVSGSGSSSAGVPAAGSVAGLPGWLYYADGDRLVRLTGSGVDPVLTAGGRSANVSPDGTSVAFVDQDNNVVVADRDGQHRRTLLRGSIGAGFEPVWSPDSKRLLAVKGTGDNGGRVFGIITVASAAFAPLPHQLREAIHPLWSADGRHLGYATGTCQIGLSDPDGGNARLVEVFGDHDKDNNPQRRRSCDPYSISADGRLIAVNQRTGDEPDGDIGRDLLANAVIDTATGSPVTLPVSGVTAVLFQPNGEILVRSAGRLTVLNPDRTVKTQLTEPATVKNYRLLAYTPA